jgi:hypothetical protein
MRMVRVLTQLLLVFALCWGAIPVSAEKNPHVASQKTITDVAGREHKRSTRISTAQRKSVAKRMNLARAKAAPTKKAKVQK